MAKQRTFSADDCVAISVVASSRCNPLKTRVARRGKLSESFPFMVTSTASLTEVMALAPAWPFTEAAQILVPGQAVLKEFLIQTGIFFFITGWMVFGCNTLAPKNDSSIASR